MTTPSLQRREPQLALFQEEANGANVKWLVEFLEGKGWMQANEIADAAGLPEGHSRRRRIACIAMASEGRIVGHQLAGR